LGSGHVIRYVSHIQAGVTVGVGVGVGVGVIVLVGVRVFVGVKVFVGVNVLVGVNVFVGVNVLVGVIVAVGVGVGVSHGYDCIHSGHPPGYGFIAEYNGKIGLYVSKIKLCAHPKPLKYQAVPGGFANITFQSAKVRLK
jgi:hypothetical protein